MSARKNLQRLLFVVTLVFSFVMSALVPSEVMAQPQPPTCLSLGLGVSANIQSPYYVGNASNSISVTVTGVTPTLNYSMYIWAGGVDGQTDIVAQNSTITQTWTNASDPDVFTGVGLSETRYIRLNGDDIPVCTLGSFELVNDDLILTNVIVYQNYDANGDGTSDQCSNSNGGCLVTGQDVIVETRIVLGSTGTAVTNASILHDVIGVDQFSAGHVGDGVYTSNIGPLDAGSHTIRVEENAFWSNPNIGEFSFVIDLPSNCTSCVAPGDINDDDSSIEVLDTYSFCNQISDATLRTNCLTCSGGDNGYAGVWTAVGCISREPTSIARTFIRIGLSMSGGVALLMILGAGFILATSEGDPKRTSEARDMITAAVIGLLFVVFSVVILQFIGFTVLQIPGFGG